MATVELKEGEVIVTQAELNELFQQRNDAIEKHNTRTKELDTERSKVHAQKVLINQTVSVVTRVKKIFPGISEGKFLQSFNPMMLMGNKELDKLGPDFEKLETLMNEYLKTNPQLIVVK